MTNKLILAANLLEQIYVALLDYQVNKKKNNPQKRMIQPTEIAALAAFLCTEQAVGITMQDLTVSAGSLW